MVGRQVGTYKIRLQFCCHISRNVSNLGAKYVVHSKGVGIVLNAILITVSSDAQISLHLTGLVGSLLQMTTSPGDATPL